MTCKRHWWGYYLLVEDKKNGFWYFYRDCDNCRLRQFLTDKPLSDTRKTPLKNLRILDETDDQSHYNIKYLGRKITEIKERALADMIGSPYEYEPTCITFG